MKKIPFTGSGVAIITPFNENGVNFEVLGELIEFQIKNKTDAIIICGTTGEVSCMPDEEHLSAIEYTVKKVAGRVPVIAGTGSNDTVHGIKLSTHAEKLGADALLLVTPYYNKTTQAGLVQHFKAISDSVNIPIILYNVPSRTGLGISLDTCKELSKIPNIVAIKEASGDIAFAAKIAAACGDDLYIYSGNDDMIVPILSIGGKGVISVLANICPKETHDMCHLYFNGDVKKSAELQIKLMDLISALFIEVNPIPAKTAVRLMGYNTGGLRLPLAEMSAKNSEVLKSEMQKAGLI